ncbi:NAD(P)/FAD-dependent oxidoreductase [Ramlibacter sp. AN1133]|uniref:NAD(P)/FAD-dependent oxidoreductase n=1 Tax=Ramlibacter sp. AN1133 TaxID=3133429 RepID=UPI0030BF2EB7
MHHVILGAGPAGVIAAETIRKHRPDDRITIIGAEREPPYSRMAIPYLLAGNIPESGTWLRHDAEHFARQRIELMQLRVTAVDSQARTVTLPSGDKLAFDRLLIATGARPVKPPIPGIDRPGVHHCWTLEDARHIMELARPGARVVQMGAGFIGCIIMEALAARGVQLAVVEMADRMVPRMMGPVAGSMIRDWCVAKGVQVFTGTRVEEIAAASPLRVRLSDGQALDADLVISATGVKPSIGFLEESGITCLAGVLTDAHMQTNVPGIYAAGDCAEAFDKITGRTMVSAIQPNAADQARIAGMNMAGLEAELSCVTYINVLDTLGLVSASFGDWQGAPGSEQAEFTDREGVRHLSLRFDGDVMVGANAIGWTQHVGVLRGLVEGQVRLGGWKDKLLEDPTRIMEAYLDAAQAQGRWQGAADGRRR